VLSAGSSNPYVSPGGVGGVRRRCDSGSLWNAAGNVQNYVLEEEKTRFEFLSGDVITPEALVGSRGLARRRQLLDLDLGRFINRQAISLPHQGAYTNEVPHI
jgi:hypothetical protein